jgi:hypothetical protein
MKTPHDDIIVSFIQGLVDTVLSAVGQDAVRSVFAGGSAAVGDLSYCEVDGRLEIFSDVDLYVVLKDGVDPDEARASAREATAQYPLAGEDFVFFRGPDVGVYTFEDLMAQPARPGTVDLADHYSMLYGDASIPVDTANFISREIDPAEGLYLIENRLMELAEYKRILRDAADRDAADRLTAFLCCKTGMDAVSSALIAIGRYDSSRVNRTKAFEASIAGGELAQWFDDEQLSFIEKCRCARERQPRHVDRPVESLEQMEAAAVALALNTWKHVAERHFPGSRGDWRTMILKRCRLGEYISNFRQFMVVSRRCGVKRAGSVKAGIHVARYRPLEMLRLYALIKYLCDNEETRSHGREIKQQIEPAIDKLTRICGFRLGTLAERTCEMYRAIH